MPGEEARMGLAGVDQAFELGVGEDAVGHQTLEDVGPVSRLGGRHGGHGRGLDEPGRMRPGAGNDERMTASTASSLIPGRLNRSEEHTSELQSLMRISYAVFCLKKK